MSAVHPRFAAKEEIQRAALWWVSTDGERVRVLEAFYPAEAATNYIAKCVQVRRLGTPRHVKVRRFPLGKRHDFMVFDCGGVVEAREAP